MAKQTLRIVIPKNVEDLLSLGTLIYARYNQNPSTDPLNTMQDFNIATIGPNLMTALSKHKEAESLRRQMEEAYRDREMLMGDVKGLVTSSRDVLKGTYAKTPKRLGEYGFTVNDTPVAKKQEPKA